ncbi:MAG: PAS domain S-box protein [Nanobdellota archaeon]
MNSYPECFKGLPIPLFVIDNTHTVTFWNTYCEKLTGVPAKQVIGKTVDSRLFYPMQPQRPLLCNLILNRDHEGLRKYYDGKNLSKKRLAKKIVYAASDKLWLKDSYKHVYFTASTILDSNRQPKGALTTIQDITGIVRLSKDLHESQKRYTRIFENIQEIYYETDYQGRIISVSPSVSTLGFAPEDIIGKDVTAFYQDPKKRNEFLKTIRREKHVTDYEITFGHQNKTLDVSISASLIQHNSKSYIVGSLRDITARKQTEKKLLQTEELLSNVINSASEIIVSVDKEGYVNTCNRTFEHEIGIKRRYLMGKNIFTDKLPESISPLVTLLKEALQSKRAVNTDHHINDTTGKKLFLSSSGTLIRYRHEITGAVLVSRKQGGQSTDIQLKEGTAYISFDNTLDKLLNLMQSHECQPLIIGREKLSTPLSPDYLLLSTPASTAELLNNTLKQLQDKAAKPRTILLTRLDFLYLMYGFSKMMQFLYRVNDITRKNGCICLIHAIPGCFSEQQQLLLTQEFRKLDKIPSRHFCMDERLYQVLEFIHKKNSFHQSVHYGMITAQFSVSRLTTKKWIDSLLALNLVRVQQKGRLKEIKITGQGRSALT